MKQMTKVMVVKITQSQVDQIHDELDYSLKELLVLYQEIGYQDQSEAGRNIDKIAYAVRTAKQSLPPPRQRLLGE